MHIETDMTDQIQLSYLEQTAYFAALRQGIQVLDIQDVQGLVTISRGHAMKRVADMARKGYQDAYGNEVSVVYFAQRDCTDCPVRQQCTQAATRPRHLKVHVRGQHEALSLDMLPCSVTIRRYL